MKTKEGEITPSLHSSLPEDLPLLRDLFSRQAGISVGTCQPKHPLMGAGALSGPTTQSGHRLVSSDLQGVNVRVGSNGNSSLTWVSQVPSCPWWQGHLHRAPGRGAFIQEGPPLVFLADDLPICAWHWLFVYAAPTYPISILTMRMWCRGDRSHASLVPVTHRWPLVASAMEVPGIGGMPLGATSVVVADAIPRLGDSD
jgi:hypothetical protein